MEQPQSDCEIELTKGILEGLRAIDKGILEGVPLKAALESVCRSVAEIFGLRLCWVGLLREGSFEVAPAAWWGFEDGYLSLIRAAYDDSEYGKGPSGTAIKTRRPVIRNDIEREPVSTPWREEALKRGYRSSAAMPMVYEDKVVGILNVYATEPDYFDGGRIRLIQAFTNQTAVLIRDARNLEALRESEARYRGLVEAAAEAIVTTDGDGKILLWNPAAERILGYTAEEAMGREFFFLVPEEIREHCRRTFEAVKKTGRLKHRPGQVIETVGLRKDGTTFPMEHSVSMEKTANGIRFTAILRDVSERHRIGEALRKSEENLRTVVANAPVVLWIADKDGTITMANGKGLTATGRSPTEIVGRSILEVAADKPEIVEYYRRALAGEEVAAVVDAWGRSFDSRYSPICRDGEIVGVIGVATDVTERKKAQEVLLESEKTFRDLTEKSLVGVYLIQDGIFKYANPKLAEIFGYAAEELVEKMGPRDLVLAEDRPIVEENLRKRVSGEIESVHYVFRVVRKDGEMIHVEVYGSRTVYRGRPAIVGTLLDITERKRAEDEIKHLKEFNEEIVQKMEEGIATLDKEGRITFFNPKTLAMLGYVMGELKGEPFGVVWRSDQRQVLEHLNRAKEEGHAVKFECTLTTKDGKEVFIFNTCTPIVRGDKFDGYLMALTDITEWKAAEEAFIEKNLKYDLSKGNLYLSEEPEMKKAMDAFQDLLKAGYGGMIVTRRHPEEIREKHQLKEEVPIHWLGSEASPGASTLPPEFSIIEKEARDFLGRRKVLLLDRLEYLASQRGFDETLAFVQRLHELAYARTGIAILSLDPATFPAHHLALLRSETIELERKDGPTIPEDLREILMFVYQENREGRKPTHTEISKRFGFSRMTRLTKLKQLRALGLIADEQRGRTKLAWITEKGRDLL